MPSAIGLALGIPFKHILSVSGLPRLNLLQFNDGTNNTLSALNKVSAYPSLKLLPKKSAALGFNGAGDFITTTAFISDITKFSFKFRNDVDWDGTETRNPLVCDEFDNERFISAGSGPGILVGETLTLTNRAGGVTSYAYITDTIPAGDHEVSFDWDGSQYQITLDGTPLTTLTSGAQNIASGWQIDLATRALAPASYDLFFDGAMYEAEIVGSNTSLHYNFAELSGPKVRDTSVNATTGLKNGNDGTITSVSGIDVMREARQDIYHRNLNYGGSKVLYCVDGDATINDSVAKMNFGTDDFTIKGFVYLDPEESGNDNNILAKYSTSGANRGFRLDHNGALNEFRFYTSADGLATTVAISDAVFPEGVWHPFEVRRVGTLISFFRDGVAAGTGSCVADIADVATSVRIGSRAGVGIYNGVIAELSVEDGLADSATYRMANMSGGAIPDESGSGNDATTNGADELFLPALDDGSDDVEGLGITNLPWNTSIGSGKKVLGNNSENTWINTDDALLYPSTFWFSGGVPVERTWAEVLAYISLTDDVTVIDFASYLNTCYWTTNGVYSQAVSEPQHDLIESRYPNLCGGGVAPFEIVVSEAGDTLITETSDRIIGE